MIIELTPPDVDPNTFINEIISEKVRYKKFYTNITDDFDDQVSLYIDYEGNPEFIEPLKLCDYVSSKEEADKRKKTLIGWYPPKKEKKGAKGVDYITDTGEKRFIHPYYDKFDYPLLVLKFSEPYNSPKFEIKINSDFDNSKIRLIQSHLDGINLKERYTMYFSTKYKAVLRIVAESRKENDSRVKDQLNSLYKHSSLISENSWDSLLYRSLILDDGILSYLEKGTLPNYL